MPLLYWNASTIPDVVYRGNRIDHGERLARFHILPWATLFAFLKTPPTTVAGQCSCVFLVCNKCGHSFLLNTKSIYVSFSSSLNVIFLFSVMPCIWDLYFFVHTSIILFLISSLTCPPFLLRLPKFHIQTCNHRRQFGRLSCCKLCLRSPGWGVVPSFLR